MQSTSLTMVHTISDKEAEQTMIDIELLARKVYKSSIVLPSELLLCWYTCNPSMWWLAKENNRLIGYICAVPLKHETFTKTLQPEFNESADITNDGIRSWNDALDKNYSLYICSIAVDPDYQNCTNLPVFRLLVEYFLESVLSYGERGCYITEWSGNAVSKVGCHVLEHYFDLTYLTRDYHGCHIWHGKTCIEHQKQLLSKIKQKLLQV